MTLEQHIQELRAELAETVDAAERRQIEIELQLAQAELAVIMAGQQGRADPDPPF